MVERTFFYAVWPMLKLFTTIWLILLTNYILSSLGAWFFLIVTCIIVSIIIRVKKRRYFSFLAVFGLLYPLLVSIPLLFLQQGTTFFELSFGSGVIIISQEGLRSAMLYTVRILATISVIALFLFTTPFVHLIHVFKQLQFPTFFLTLLILTYRFFFELFESLMKILQAEACRHFRRYTFIERFSLYSNIFGMLILRALHRGTRVHRAMVARGFTGVFPILNFHPNKFHIIIYCVAMSFISLGAILINIYIPLNMDLAGAL